VNLNLTTLGLSSLSLLSVTSSLIADDPKPNIIFFMADDHQAMTLGCMGNTQVKTPTLDSLAAKGLIFDKAYATSPICMPSRATVMTGMYEYKTGCNFNTGALSTLDWKETSYPMLLKKNGYSIAFAGKWGYKLEDSYDYISDFDAWGGFETFRQGSYNTHDNVSLTSYASTYPHVTRALGAFGSDFIKNHANTGTPFCLSISFKAPHKPHDNIDPADQALFPGVTFNTALNYGDQYFNPLPPQPKLGRQRAQWNEWAPPEYQNHIKAYYQLIAGLDSAVKMILDELDNQGIANNTIIIYTSDNGYALGSHGFQGKTLPYEEQSRIPLIIYDPLGNVHGERTSTLVANIDFAPTILAYAGITKPNKMDGKSLKDLTRVNKDAKIHDDILLIQNWASGNCDFPKALSVVNDSWKYIFWCYGNPDITPAEQLYNLTNDPHEIADTIKNNPVNLPDMRSKYDYYLSLWASGARPKYERAITLYDRTIPWQQKDFIGASGTYVSKEAYRDYVGAEPPPGLIGAHKLFVYEGIGNGRYDTGETGIITANIHPGKVFDQWVGDIANVTDVFAPQTTVVMPDANILITATFKDPSPNTYTVSGTVSGIVNGGVLISLDNNSQTVITDTNGYYSISGVLNGDHEITAIRSGCTFDPPTQTFSIVGSDESNINFSASSTKIISYEISGTITEGGTPSANVDVNINGNVTTSVKTDANGNYIFAALPEGTYTITPNLSGFSFAPVNQSVYIITSSVTGIDFTATPDSSTTYKLTVENGTGSGNFAENANVNITATIPGGKTFKEWSGDGAQYAADKNSATTTITMPNHDITITANFQNITVNTYSISGTISGDIISGVTISADSTHSAVSDSSGNYTINDLTAGSYTVKPIYNGYTFSPSERSVTVTDTDISAVDFISDEIIPSGGVPTSISGCMLWLDASDPNADGTQPTGNIETWKDKSGTGNNAIQSDSTMQAVATSNALNGNSVLTFDGTDDFYSFNKITNIRTIFWVLKEVNQTSDGSSLHFLLGDDGNYDFHRGSGTLWDSIYAADGIKNSATRVDRADFDGLTADMPADKYIIVSLVTSADLTASQVTKDRGMGRSWDGGIAEIIIYNQPLADTDRDTVEDYLYNKWFASSPTQFSISGNITSNGTPLAQVSVELSGNASSTTTTDASGNYSFANLPDGNTYTITPALSGYSFNPANKTVTISNADQTGIDFTATPDCSPTYRLTVENGTGSGNFAENTKVNITATVPGGKTFKEWSGDGAQYAADKNSATTTITIPNHDITITANFQNITVDTYSISGTISGDIISGVTISADSTHSAVSDSSGNYTINNLTAGSYTVTPNSKDYIFEPINKIVILQNTDIQNLNFQAIKSTSPSEKNNPPVALEDEYFVEQSKILTVSDAAGVLANDIDIDNDKLTANLKTGSLSLNQNGGFTFTAPSKTGDITFTYQANDGQSDSNVTTVIIHVIAAGTPLPPTPIDDQYSATIDQTITASHENGVLVNDLNLNGNETVTISNNVTNGKLTLNNDGTFTYTPNKDFTGLDRFVYQISGTTETASVYLKIMPQKNIKISLGSLLEFKAEDIPNLGSDKFIKPPKLYGLYQGKKMSLKKVKSSTTTLFKGIWSKKIRLYDKSVLKNGYKSYFEKHGSLKPQKISIALKGKTATKKNIDLTIKDVFLVPPVISSINGVSVTDPTQPAVSKGSLITIQGQYFGTKLPKVSIEVNGKLLRCKVDKNSLSYKNNKGKLSAMDPLTGESSIKIVLPVKNLQKGTYPIVLDNKIGIATTPGENAILPEITIK
jgi:arylsulfatase A-like enzyme